MFESIHVPVFRFTLQLRVISILIILILAGAFIRFHNLTYSSLWLDEIFSMQGSDPNTTLADVYNYSKKDQPPLYFLLLYGWLKAFGYTDFSGRALSCVIGLGGIVATYLLGKTVRDEKLGLVSAFLCTINWFHIDLSKEIRFYSLVYFLSALSFLFFIRSLKKQKITDFALYAVFTALLLNTHYYAMVVFTSQFITFILVVLLFKRSISLLIGGLFFGILSALSLLHFLPVILGDLQIESFHISPLKPSFGFDLIWNYFRDPVAFAIYIFCVFLVMREAYGKLRRHALQIEHVVVFNWIFLGLIIPIAYSLLKMPLITFKYTTIIVPAVIIIIASGFVYIGSAKLRSYAFAAILLSGFIVLFFARPPYKHRRAEDWRDVAAYFKNGPQHNGIIFSQLAWFHQYYFKKNDLSPPYDQNVVDFGKLIKAEDSVWLLLNARYSGGWPVSGFLPVQQDSINAYFQVLDTVNFKQTSAILFTRRR